MLNLTKLILPITRKNISDLKDVGITGNQKVENCGHKNSG
jgi:hypothetical protein